MMRIVIFTLLFIHYFSPLKAQHNSPANIINWGDSIAITEIANKMSLCKKLLLVKDSADVFINNKGYSILLLSSITANSTENFFIPISTGPVIFSLPERKQQLIEQVDEKLQRLCK